MEITKFSNLSLKLVGVNPFGSWALGMAVMDKSAKVDYLLSVGLCTS